jgi:hypothetical protein
MGDCRAWCRGPSLPLCAMTGTYVRWLNRERCRFANECRDEAVSAVLQIRFS